MINATSFNDPLIIAYGYNLFTVFLIWVVVMALLYPICKKSFHRDMSCFILKNSFLLGAQYPFSYFLPSF